MKLKTLLFFLLLAGILPAQITFSRTYNDTIIFGGPLSAGNSRPVAGGGGYYLVSEGIGPYLEQGAYIRILQVDEQGEVLRSVFNYTDQYRYGGGPNLVKTKDDYLVLASAIGGMNMAPTRRIFAQKLSLDLADTLWSYYHSDSTEWDVPSSMMELPDGNIAITGTRDPKDGGTVNRMDFFLLKLSPEGEKQFFSIYDLGPFEATTTLALASDGFLLSGNITRPGNPNVAFVLKTDFEGNQQWIKYYTQMSSAYISQYHDNKYILSGYSVGSQSTSRLLLIDSSGAVIHSRVYAYTQSAANYVGRKVSDGGVICVGITTNPEESNAGYILKTDSTGMLLWQRRYNYNEDVDYFIDFIETPDRGLLISGAAADSFHLGGQNAWLVKLDSMGCLEPGCWQVGIEDVKENSLGITLYPNPARDWLNVKLPAPVNAPVTLELFSLTGQRVLHTQLIAPLEGIQVSHLAEGLYLVKLTTGEGKSVTERVVIGR